MEVMAASQSPVTQVGRIVTISNPYTEISMHHALELEVQGKFEDAIAAYDTVLEMDPREARAHHAKGDIYDLMGRLDEALECYSSALEYDPFNAETWYNKGVTLKKMGRDEESAVCMLQGVSRSL